MCSSVSTSFSHARSATEDFGSVRSCTAELFDSHYLVCDRLYQVRPGYEHLGAVANHKDEDSHSGRVYRAHRAGSMAEICGTTLDASTLRLKTSA